MKKKVILALGALGTAAAILPLFAAFEAHIINVTAHIENALDVNRKEITFGTVFPEEQLLSDPFDIALSRSFLEQRRLDDVTYVIKQKPKCERDAEVTDPTLPLHKPIDPITDQCPEFYHEMPLLCPYLSKEDADPDDQNDKGLAALHGLPGPYDPNDPANQATGQLTIAGNDILDLWQIDLLVPCFVGQCAQDNVIPPAYQLPCDDVNQDGQCDLNGETFGCDLWVEVNGYSESPGTITITKIPVFDDPGIDESFFNLLVDATEVVSGSPTPFAPGTYAISETDNGGLPPYTSVIGGDADCTDGSVDLSSGESISCTITNTEFD